MNNKLKFGLVAIGVVIAGLVAAPMLAASSFKTKALNETNQAVEKINQATDEFDKFNAKETPTADETKTLVDKEKAAKQAVDQAKANTSSVGGFAGLDILGQYSDAKKVSEELEVIFTELSELYRVDIIRTESLAEVTEVLDNSASLSDPSQFGAAGSKLTNATKKYNEFANGRDGTELDKKTAKAIDDLAKAFQQLTTAAGNQDVAALEKVTNELTSIEKNFVSLQAEGDKFNQDLLAKFNSLVEKLNASAAKL